MKHILLQRLILLYDEKMPLIRMTRLYNGGYLEGVGPDGSSQMKIPLHAIPTLGLHWSDEFPMKIMEGTKWFIRVKGDSIPPETLGMIKITLHLVGVGEVKPGLS